MRRSADAERLKPAGRSWSGSWADPPRWTTNLRCVPPKGALALNAVSSGFIQRFARGHIGTQQGFGPGSEGDARAVRETQRFGVSRVQATGGDDGVGVPRQSGQHGQGMFLGAGLAQNVAVQYHNSARRLAPGARFRRSERRTPACPARNGPCARPRAERRRRGLHARRARVRDPRPQAR